MALFGRLRKSASRSRNIMLWVVGTLLFLQLLAVLSTWQCSGGTHRAREGKPPFTSLLLWLSGHGMCEGEVGSSTFPFEGVLGHSRSVRHQRPYAYAFCLTSIHHLWTALINVVRLRKLQSFQVTSASRCTSCAHDVHLVVAFISSYASVCCTARRCFNACCYGKQHEYSVANQAHLPHLLASMPQDIRLLYW